MAWDPHLFYAMAMQVAGDHDCLPHHYIMHLVHAAEVIGYNHPQDEIRGHFRSWYLLMCRKLHVNPETEAQMNERLNADEETFLAGQ